MNLETNISVCDDANNPEAKPKGKHGDNLDDRSMDPAKNSTETPVDKQMLIDPEKVPVQAKGENTEVNVLNATTGDNVEPKEEQRSTNQTNSEYQASVTSMQLPQENLGSYNTGNNMIKSGTRSATEASPPHLPPHITNYTKYPTRMIRLATVPLASGKPGPRTAHRSNYVETPTRQNNRVIALDEAINARPPLRIDMDGPTACSYSPTNKPPRETNSPAWSFGRRTFVEKGGGTRTSWEKTWFQTPHIWYQKCDFHSDNRWPSPAKYEIKPMLGPRQSTKLEPPSFSIGVRRVNKTKKKAAQDPAPNEYNPDSARELTSRTAPAFTHGFRRSGTRLWSSLAENVPGPGTHNPNYRLIKPHNPCFSIQGIRREKEHTYGPFATF